jgi:hypothetical protein
MDAGVLLIMGATLAAIVINGLILNRLVRQVQNQCDNTRALTATNRNLEYRVDRLAMAVDQSLQQLHRALELTSRIHLLMYNKLHDPSYNLPHDYAGRISTYLLELKAIAVVSGDKEFITRVSRLREAVDLILNPPGEGDERAYRRLDVSDETEGVQRKVYDLLASATRARVPPKV